MTAYRVLTTPEFERDYSALPSDIVGRIDEKIDRLATHPELARFPLKGLPESLKGLHKYRIGDYRVLFWPDHEKKEIVLYAIAHRREIYRKLDRV
jgi:mRNA interferase RelE/StbE